MIKIEKTLEYLWKVKIILIEEICLSVRKSQFLRITTVQYSLGSAVVKRYLALMMVLMVVLEFMDFY